MAVIFPFHPTNPRSAKGALQRPLRCVLTLKERNFLLLPRLPDFSLEKTETQAIRTGTLERSRMILSLPALIAAGPTAVLAASG